MFGRATIMLSIGPHSRFSAFNCLAACTAACGGLLMAGDHVSAFYSHASYGDQNYDNRVDCGWLIAAHDQRRRVRVRFQTFEIEAETECGSVVSSTSECQRMG